jgi:hypothetical protein
MSLRCVCVCVVATNQKAARDLQTSLERYFEALMDNSSHPETPDEMDRQSTYSFREFAGRRKLVSSPRRIMLAGCEAIYRAWRGVVLPMLMYQSSLINWLC